MDHAATIGGESAMAFKSDFFYKMGLIAFTIGLLNTRLLFRHMRELKGAFIGPYIIQVIVVALPLILVETCLSQYGQKDMIQIWDAIPIFRGLGYACFGVMFFMLVEYNVVLTYILRYMTTSFSITTGWDSCYNQWNTVNCYTLETNISRRHECATTLGKIYCENIVWESSFHQYWMIHILKYDPEGTAIGTLNFPSVISSLCIAVAIFVITSKGTKILQIFVTMSIVTCCCEYIILLYLSFLSPGSADGLKYFFDWEFPKWGEITTWTTTLKHAVVSLGAGLGALRTLGSLSTFRGNGYNNALAITLIDVGVTGGYVILYLSLCGNLRYFTSEDITRILQERESELFVKLPRIMVRLPGQNRFWRTLFFSKLFLTSLAKSSMMCYILMQTIFNRFPVVDKFVTLISAGLNLAVFLAALPLFTSIGYTIFRFCIEEAMIGPVILLLNFLQSSALHYIYGLGTIVDDCHFMLGFRFSFILQLFLYLSPLYLGIIWYYSLVHFYTVSSVEDLQTHIEVFRNAILYAPFAIGFGYMTYFTIITKCQFHKFFKPHDRWALKDLTLRKSRQMFSAHSMTKEYLYRQSRRKDMASYTFDEDDISEDI